MTATLTRWTLALAVAVIGTACGGSSSKTSTGSCVRAAIPTAGPGDVSNHFPAAVGSTWHYTIDAPPDTVTRSVTGTQLVGTETASVFTSTSSTSTTVEQVVKRPSGVYVLADASVDPLLAPTYPSLVLPFPVAVTPATQQVSCTDLDIGDADGDGKSDRADLTSTLQVLSITDTSTVAAGTFANVAHVQTDVEMTVRATKAGTLTVHGTQDDWYAPGVGLVISRMVLTLVGYTTETQAMSLASYTIPSAAMASPGAPVSRAAARAPALPGGPGHRATLEEAVLEAARRLAR
jgi:hypothetical protein